jgi:hypothetical protein
MSQSDGENQVDPFSPKASPLKVWGPNQNRRFFIGGSDARIIMGDDEKALVRLWREKRGEVESEDLSGNLLVQLGGGDRRPQSALV